MRNKRTAITCLVLSVAVVLAPGQQQEPEPEVARTRAMWNTAFLNRRPQKLESKATSGATTVVAGGAAAAGATQPKTAVAKANPPAAAVEAVQKLGNAFMGVTLWRLTRGLAAVPAVRFRGLVLPDDPDGSTEWTPERVSLKSSFQGNDMVRLSVESAREGYLYIIDRDVYADGTTSEPNLIFPNSRLMGGRNKVRPGIPYEIPEATNKLPAFRMVKTRPDQVGIKITMIVAPQPIKEIRVGRTAQKLDPAKAAEWEKKWGQEVLQIEDPKLIGKTYSPVEAAAAGETDSLGSDDPLPTSLFKSGAPEDQPMLVNLTLNMK